MNRLVVFIGIFAAIAFCWGKKALADSPEGQTNKGGTLTHAHFAALIELPECLASWTLRRPEDYLMTRGGKQPKNEHVRYDEALDAARVSIPPRANELGLTNAPMLYWKLDHWDPGNKLVVQHDFLVSKSMHDLVPTKGNNGRRTTGYKFTNLCRERHITYELRTEFAQDEHTLLDVRAYTAKLEGRQERDEFASDVRNPTQTFVGSGGGLDRHPGPDSNHIYGQSASHPECFKAINDRWVRITYELERVEQGTRVKIWLADEEVTPKLVVASPVDPEFGFLTANTQPITSLYIELDTSQETSYDEDQPERWAAFRNVVVLRDVDGEEVLGGKPKR